uniref:Uncharacterized protein n=1 Tax=Anguilla anguilla TaxID=7936 RepID=A0A0E9QQM0_ANGAN
MPIAIYFNLPVLTLRYGNISCCSLCIRSFHYLTPNFS